MSDSDIQELLLLWLTSSIAKFRRCDKDLQKRDDLLLTFEEDLSDTEQEILATMMVNEWLAPQVYSELYTSQFYGGKEEKFYAQANQLEKLMTLDKTNKIAAQKLMRDYGYEKLVWGDS